MSELEVRPKLRFWAKMSMKQTLENWTSKNSASDLTNPLEMVKKIGHALELLNSDVRARSLAQNTILGQDEHETDTENRTSTNSVSELPNPLEMVKKHVRLWNCSILMSELEVMPKIQFWAKMSMKQTRKIGHQEIQFLTSQTP